MYEADEAPQLRQLRSGGGEWEHSEAMDTPGL